MIALRNTPDKPTVRGWIALNRDVIVEFCRAQGARIDQWERTGSVPIRFWKALAQEMDDPQVIDRLMDAHGFGPGAQRVLTLVYLDGDFERLAEEVGVGESVLARWRQRDRVPDWALAPLMEGLRKIGRPVPLERLWSPDARIRRVIEGRRDESRRRSTDRGRKLSRRRPRP